MSSGHLRCLSKPSPRAAPWCLICLRNGYLRCFFGRRCLRVKCWLLLPLSKRCGNSSGCVFSRLILLHWHLLSAFFDPSLLPALGPPQPFRVQNLLAHHFLRAGLKDELPVKGSISFLPRKTGSVSKFLPRGSCHLSSKSFVSYRHGHIVSFMATLVSLLIFTPCVNLLR